jgi:hypothetical protein
LRNEALLIGLPSRVNTKSEEMNLLHFYVDRAPERFAEASNSLTEAHQKRWAQIAEMKNLSRA